jgi:hypothetical protein
VRGPDIREQASAVSARLRQLVEKASGRGAPGDTTEDILAAMRSRVEEAFSYFNLRLTPP